ncbi:hypothetical protein OS493_021355 [Desmophyllum pertusum]|uniref:Uncharacterized protein n=1 Tax=Desmophyllum pertusum TaxID=174260 RepID=A0A9W9ZD18_9CNID|nr:hypothetical protein OS493_021355 [Desmophyllum pertusum]
MMSPIYQLFANVQQPVRCGNKTCIKKVKESDLKSCGRCGNQNTAAKIKSRLEKSQSFLHHFQRTQSKEWT